ncbi:MAG: hypothetical protein ACRCXD_16930 [Luteolibacter sp.]
MNRRQQNKAQAFLRSSEFAETRLVDFTHQPPTKVDVKFVSAQARLAATITTLGGKQAIQAGGSFAEETEKQRALREDLEDELEDINASADSIASETGNPSIMERFRMPDGNGDTRLIAKARAFATAICELSLNDEFEAHGHGADTAADLEQLATALEGSEGQQGTALGQRAGATATIPETIRTGTAAIKTLNAIFRRVYKKNAEVLAAWETASHVQRSPRAVKPAETVVKPA